MFLKDDIERDAMMIINRNLTFISFVFYPIPYETAKTRSRFKFGVFIWLKQHKAIITKHFYKSLVWRGAKNSFIR